MSIDAAVVRLRELLKLITPGEWYGQRDTYGVPRIWANVDHSPFDVACTEGDGSIEHDERRANEELICLARNSIEAILERNRELEEENARLKSGLNATTLGCEPIFLRAASPRCKEFHGQIPYTSEHCWRQDHHGIPAGPCINCGEDYQAYTKRAHGEIALLPATRIDESDGKSWVCPTCKDPNCG